MDADFGVNALLNEEKKTKQVKRVMKEKVSIIPPHGRSGTRRNEDSSLFLYVQFQY